MPKIKVTEMYIEGIKEGRASFRQHGIEFGVPSLENLNRTIKGFDATSPIGQILRGERDFWRNQLKRVV